MFWEFSHTIVRELKEIMNKLRKFGTLAAIVVAIKRRWTRSRTPPKHDRTSHCEFTRTSEVQFIKHKIPRYIFTVCGLQWVNSCEKNRGIYIYFPQFSVSFLHIESLKFEQIQVNASFLQNFIVYLQNTARNLQKLYTSSSLILYHVFVLLVKHTFSPY